LHVVQINNTFDLSIIKGDYQKNYHSSISKLWSNSYFIREPSQNASRAGSNRWLVRFSIRRDKEITKRNLDSLSMYVRGPKAPRYLEWFFLFWKV